MSKSEVVNSVLWTERYRPQTLERMALDEGNRQVLKGYLDAGEIPHLLLVGPPGSGKTTIARILVDALDCSCLTLNASSERGIDTVRLKIGSFVTAITGAQFNIVFLDEADAMTSDAQTALRNLIESYSDRARFILTANYGHRIIAPIQSRCQMLTFGIPPLKERYRILTGIINAEGVDAEPQIIVGYAEKYPDLRKLLWAVQRAVLSGGKTLTTPASADAANGDEMFQYLIAHNWTGFRRLTTSGDFDVQQALRELFYAVPDEHPKAGFLRHVIGRGVHETGFTPDTIVLFLAVVAEAMEGL